VDIRFWDVHRALSAYERGSAPQRIKLLDTELKDLQPQQPVSFSNHYPIDNGLDNWYEITDRLRNYNTWAILCGHVMPTRP